MSATTIQALQKAGKLPSGLSDKQAALLQRSLDRYSGQVSDKVLTAILDDFRDKLKTATTMTDVNDMRGIMADLQANIGGSESLAKRLKWSLRVSQEVAAGAGTYLNQNLTAEAVDEYPALELKRIYSRDVPRGTKDPEDSWPARWEAAGGELIDGRMVALKDDPIWQALGDGDGGYDDTLGNPFAPFAFNSGYETLDVSRKESVSLGLIGENEHADPAPIDFGTLLKISNRSFRVPVKILS